VGKPQAIVTAPLKFRTSTNILDLLGVQMYSSVPKAISELVVNGYDADATYVTVTSGSTEIVVEDNGEAMDEEAIRTQYMFLGSRHKRNQPFTARLHRRPIGAKGIGKLAGLGIARRMRSSRGGTASHVCGRLTAMIWRSRLERDTRARSTELSSHS